MIWETKERGRVIYILFLFLRFVVGDGGRRDGEKEESCNADSIMIPSCSHVTTFKDASRNFVDMFRVSGTYHDSSSAINHYSSGVVTLHRSPIAPSPPTPPLLLLHNP